MKKITLISIGLIAMLLSGCKKDPNLLPKEPMTFAPSFATESSEEPTEIHVFAFGTGKMSWEEAGEAATANLMYDQLLQNTGGTWSSPVINWPRKEGEMVSFFAYAGDADLISSAETPGAPVISHDLNDDAHTDVFVATPVLDRQHGTQSVALEMRSIMSKVGFRIQGKGEQVSKIAVRAVREKGTVALDKNETGSSDVWTLSEDVIDMTEFETVLAFDEGKNYVTAPAEMTNVMAEGGELFLIPQNVHFLTRIVMTIDGKEVGFPFETVFQFLPGREYIIDIDINSLPLDWTDNASPSLLLAPQDALAATNDTKANIMAACEADGYRLPTYNEGLLILTYLNGIENNQFRFASYWASTWYKTEDAYWLSVDASMGYDYTTRAGIYMGAGPAITAGRCVKDGPEGKHYPYVDTSSADGPIIVSRDADGGVNPSSSVTYDGGTTLEYFVFHDNWTVTPEEHLMGSDDDRISRKLQVANTDATAGMVLRADMACADGWRTPTAKELSLIYAMGGGADALDTDPTSNFYNPAATETALSSVAGFTSMKPDHYWAETYVSGRGGTNPVSLSFTETTIYGMGTMNPTTYQMEAYVRCVKDIE